MIERYDVNEDYAHSGIIKAGDFYYLIYPQCYCSCVKRNPEQLSRTWCYCTLGYSKRMFENIFGTEVQVELLSSVKMGDDNCRIRIMQA